jgi:hypothetical protein
MRQQRLPRRATRRSVVVLTITALAAAVASACAEPTRSSTAPATRPAPATSRPAPPDPTRSVLAAYQEFWRVWLEANDPPDPNDPDLAKVDTGPQLAGARATIARHRARGEVVRLPPHSAYAHHARVALFASGTRATVIDCAIDDSMLVVAATRQVLDDSIQTQLIDADLVLEAGRWKVASTRFVKTWTGGTRCDRS